jgi:hypothetical protein
MILHLIAILFTNSELFVERIKPVALFIPLAYCLDNRFLHSDDAPVMISMELDPPVKYVNKSTFPFK